MASSTKYDKAVNRATGQDPTHAPDAILDKPPMTAGAMALVSEVDDTAIAELMTRGDLEFAPQVLSMKEGQMVRGVLEGHGPQAEVADPVTKEIKLVDTWIIASPDGSARVSILDAAQLTRKLPPFVGGEVTIVRGKEIKTASGRRVSDYLVAGPKLANGQRRVFATLPAASTQAALPATTDAPTAAA